MFSNCPCTKTGPPTAPSEWCIMSPRCLTIGRFILIDVSFISLIQACVKVEWSVPFCFKYSDSFQRGRVAYLPGGLSWIPREPVLPPRSRFLAISNIARLVAFSGLSYSQFALENATPHHYHDWLGNSEQAQAYLFPCPLIKVMDESFCATKSGVCVILSYNIACSSGYAIHNA